MSFNKPISFFLLSLLFINSSGLFIHFQLRRMQIRMQMQQQICKDPQNCDCLRFSTNDYDKLDGDAYEFRFQGKWYDVVKTTKNRDSVIVFCIRDIDEERLVNTFAEKLKRADQSHETGQIPAKIFKLLQSDYMSISKIELCLVPELISLFSHEIQTPFHSLSQDVLSPPPWLFQPVTKLV